MKDLGGLRGRSGLPITLEKRFHHHQWEILNKVTKSFVMHQARMSFKNANRN
jgi:hypothetical protein